MEKEKMYLIYSKYWSKNNGYDTYWGPNGNGYTKYITDAGLYTEEYKNERDNESFNRRDKFILFDEKIARKAKRQLKKTDKMFSEEYVKMKKRHDSETRRLEKDVQRQKERERALANMINDYIKEIEECIIKDIKI